MHFGNDIDLFLFPSSFHSKPCNHESRAHVFQAGHKHRILLVARDTFVPSMLMSIKNVDFNKRSLIFHLNYAWLFQRSRRSEKILISRFYDTSFLFFFFDALLKRFKFRINILSQHRNNFNFSSVFWNWFLRKFVNHFQYISISLFYYFFYFLFNWLYQLYRLIHFQSDEMRKESVKIMDIFGKKIYERYWTRYCYNILCELFVTLETSSQISKNNCSVSWPLHV